MYIESNPLGHRDRRSWDLRAGPGFGLGFGDTISIKLDSGETVSAQSQSVDSTGELAIDSMGQAIAAQTIAIPGKGTAFLGPVPNQGYVIVRVTAKTGNISVSVG